MQLLLIFFKFNFKIVSRLLSLIILHVFSPGNRIDMSLNSLPYKEQSLIGTSSFVYSQHLFVTRTFKLNISRLLYFCKDDKRGKS